jgi:23S rRNA pseudouridine955/2504/2580 synthase
LAKKRSALVKLQDQFRERETGKTYLALVQGSGRSGCKVLDQPLHKYLLPGPASAGSRWWARTTRMAMRAVTLVKVARRFDAFSLLEVTIKTGRTHQIRVHLASEGPSDRRRRQIRRLRAEQVAAAPKPVPLRRMFLHAWRLQFDHPGSGERMELRCHRTATLDHAIPSSIDRVDHATRPTAPV